MIDFSFQSVLFGDFEYIKYSPDNSLLLLNNFKDFGFNVASFSEGLVDISPTGFAKPLSPIESRLMLHKDGCVIKIGSDKIDIIKDLEDPIKMNNISVSDFVLNSKEYYKKFKELFDIPPCKRIGFLNNVFLDNPEEECKKHISPISFYNGFSLKNWETRYSSRFDHNEINEEVNVSVRFKKFFGKISGNNENLEKVFLTIDINTLFENLKPRFSSDEVSKFFEGSLCKLTDILKEVGSER